MQTYKKTYFSSWPHQVVPDWCLLSGPSISVVSDGSPSAAGGDFFDTRKQTTGVCTGKGTHTKAQGLSKAEVSWDSRDSQLSS